MGMARWRAEGPSREDEFSLLFVFDVRVKRRLRIHRHWTISNRRQRGRAARRPARFGFGKKDGNFDGLAIVDIGAFER